MAYQSITLVNSPTLAGIEIVATKLTTSGTNLCQSNEDMWLQGFNNASVGQIYDFESDATRILQIGIPILPSVAYTVKIGTAGYKGWIQETDADNVTVLHTLPTNGDPYTFTTNANTDEIDITLGLVGDGAITPADAISAQIKIESGNVATAWSAAPEDVRSVIVKRKKLSSALYTTIATVLTPVPADMTFHLLDKNVLSGNSYQYLLVPVVDEVEYVGVSATVVCNLPFLHISDTSGALFAYMNISISEQRNTSVNYVKPLYGKYPHAVRNSDANYSSGSAEALYLPFTVVTCVPDTTQATLSNFNALELLTNGLQKVMRTPDGRGWTISVNGEPRVNKDEFFGADTITFDWTEIAAFPETGVTVL